MHAAPYLVAFNVPSHGFDGVGAWNQFNFAITVNLRFNMGENKMKSNETLKRSSPIGASAYGIPQYEQKLPFPSTVSRRMPAMSPSAVLITGHWSNCLNLCITCDAELLVKQHSKYSIITERIFVIAVSLLFNTRQMFNQLYWAVNLKKLFYSRFSRLTRDGDCQFDNTFFMCRQMMMTRTMWTFVVKFYF